MNRYDFLEGSCLKSTLGQVGVGSNIAQNHSSTMSDSEQCSNRLQLDLMLILDNFLCELSSHIIWPFRLNITFGWLQKLNPGYKIYIISYQVNLSSEGSAMFNSLMPSLNIRFPSRCQYLSSGAIRPGGLLCCETNPALKYERYGITLKVIFKVRNVQFGPLWSISANISETIHRMMKVCMK